MTIVKNYSVLILYIQSTYFVIDSGGFQVDSVVVLTGVGAVIEGRCCAPSHCCSLIGSGGASFGRGGNVDCSGVGVVMVEVGTFCMMRAMHLLHNKLEPAAQCLLLLHICINKL